jgi:hypothetical protein
MIWYNNEHTPTKHRHSNYQVVIRTADGFTVGRYNWHTQQFCKYDSTPIDNSMVKEWAYIEQEDKDDKRITRETILDDAKSCVCGQREQDYGTPESNFGLIAELWTAYTNYNISALDVAMMMALLKIARIKNGGGTGDSFVDLAGYAACGGEIHSNSTTATQVNKLMTEAKN